MQTNSRPPLPWYCVLLVWSAIAFGVLLAGGVALKAFSIFQNPEEVELDWFYSLLVFSAGGGLTIGLLILTWWLVTRRGFSWTLGFAIVVLVLIALFVWPTRYRYKPYSRSEDDCRLLRIERLTGNSECIHPASGRGYTAR